MTLLTATANAYEHAARNMYDVVLAGRYIGACQRLDGTRSEVVVLHWDRDPNQARRIFQTQVCQLLCAAEALVCGWQVR